MPVSASLALSIQVLGEAIQLTPALSALPILKASRTILQLIDDNKSEDRDAQRLAQFVFDIAVAYLDGMKRLDKIGCDDGEMRALSHNLFRCLDSISQTLQKMPKGGFLARSLSRSKAQRALKGCEADLSHAASVLEAQIQLHAAKLTGALEVDARESRSAMEESLTQANQETLALIKSQMLKQDSRKLHRSSFAHIPPVASPIFFGRSDQVGKLVESLLNIPAYHAILGPGGIGKTSVALNVLHDPRIIKVYGKHRYFLACETVADANGIVSGLADIFNVDEKSFFKSFKRVCAATTTSILFLLDNFETPWEQTETRRNVENLLSELSSIPNLSIVITLRGAERPGGVSWTRPFLPILGPLDFSAARQTFVSIADVDDNDADMARLLEEVENVPLAITLLAAQTQYTSCNFLLEQWQTCKTSMVTQGWDSRLSSLDASIALSLTSSRFTGKPEALSLLQILSLLPDGATTEELRCMTPDGFDIYGSVTTLLQVALAHTGARNRLRTLAPIREYIQLKHAISQPLFQPVFSYHAGLSSYASASEWNTEAADMDDKLSSCIGNIHNIIRIGLKTTDFTERAIIATLNVSSFRQGTYCGSIALLLEESLKLASLGQKPSLQAECLQQIGLRMASPSHGYQSAQECLIAATEILRGSPGNIDQLIYTLTNLAWVLQRAELPQESYRIAQEAVNLITDSTPPVTSALARMHFARSLIITGNSAAGFKNMELAGSYFDPKTYPILALKYAHYLSNTYINRDMYQKAVEAADAGLSLNTGFPRFESLGRRGMCHMYVGQYEAARDDFRERIHLLASFANEQNISGVLIALGTAHLASWDLQAASALFHATYQFDDTAYPVPSGPNLALATLALYQGHLEQANDYCERAIEDILHRPMLSASRFHLQQIHCQVHIRRGDACHAFTSCVIAAICAHAMNDRASIAASIMWLGDAFFFIEKDVATASACYHAFLDLVRYLGVVRWNANVLLRLGVTDYLQGDTPLATRRLNQAIKFYEMTEGDVWVGFCKDLLRAIAGGISEENIPVFPPISLFGF